MELKVRQVSSWVELKSWWRLGAAEATEKICLQITPTGISNILYLLLLQIYLFLYHLRLSFDFSIRSNFFLKGHSRIRNIRTWTNEGIALETVIPPLYVVSITCLCACVCVSRVMLTGAGIRSLARFQAQLWAQIRGWRWGIYLVGPKPSRNCMSGLQWQLRPEPGYTSPLICSSPSHHPSANLLVHKQYFQQHPPKPSQEIYLAVEVENEYFTVDLADQLPTSCCCILCLVRDNTET